MNPYAKYLGNRDPLTVLTETPHRISELLSKLGPQGMSLTYQPGKWNVAQILTHLAQVELMFGTRFRQAATIDGYVIQPFDQDNWMAREPVGDGRVEAAAFLSLRQWNLGFYRGLSGTDRERILNHPEQGVMTINDLMALVAGHDINHIEQLEKIVAAG